MRAKTIWASSLKFSSWIKYPAIALILGGVALLAQSLVGIPLTLLALGMLLYTVINSPGYFAQEGQWSLVVMFGILTILSLASIILLVGSLDQFILVG